MVMRFSLRQIEYFVAAGEEQHYGRAARRLRVAQPALSRQILDLEQEVGFKLFERLPRGVKLSAAGTLFLVDARRILQDVNEAVGRAARRAASLTSCRIRRASARNSVPAALNFTPRGRRSKSLKPTSSSKSRIWRDRAGCATRRRRAARP